MPARILATFLTTLFLFSACAGTTEQPDESEDTNYQGVAVQDSSISDESLGAQYGPAAGPDAAAALNNPQPLANLPALTPPPEIPAAALPASPTPAAALAPVLPPPEAPKLCLILGPGMAKAFAQAAVLDAIHKANIPVYCVVGTEMGALVGALYSQAGGSANALQWQLFKLNKDNYFSFPMLSLREPKATGRKLNEFLHEAFRGETIEKLPIHFATLAMDLERDAAVPFEKGDIANALSATLAMPGIFDPWRVDGEPLYSGAVSSPAPMELARKLGGNFFVLIDVLEDSSGGVVSEARFQKAFSPVRNLLRLQKKDASFVIEVPAGNIPFDDFSRQGDVLAAGAKAAEASVPALKAAWEKFQSGSH